MQDYESINGLEEAKLVISLKLDEIGSIENKLKMAEKKANIKVAECNYKLEQEKARSAQLQKKLDKARECLESEKIKHFEVEKSLNEEILKLKETERKKERQYKSIIAEEMLRTDKEKEKVEILQEKLNLLKRVFPIKMILQETQKKMIEEVPTYLELLRQVREKEEAIKCLMDSMQQFKADTLSQMEESFRKLSSYEEVMEELSKRNAQLEDSVRVREMQLKEKQKYLENKDTILQKVEIYTNEKLHELNEQIVTLKKSIRQYEGEDFCYEDMQKQHQQKIALLAERVKQMEGKQEKYLSKIDQLTEQCDQLTKLCSQLKSHTQQALTHHKDEIEHAQQIIQRLTKKQDQLTEMNRLISTSQREYEDYYEKKKKEAQRYVIEINDLIKRRRKMEEDMEERENQAKTREAILLQKLETLLNGKARTTKGLKKRNSISIDLVATQEDCGEKNDQDNQNIHAEDEIPQERLSLLHELDDDLSALDGERNYFELYKNALVCHNRFVRQVHTLLASKMNVVYTSYK